MLDKIHLMICIFAAIVVTILSIIQRVEPLRIATMLIYVIILFYFAGLIVQKYLLKYIFVDNLTEDEEELVIEDENIL